MASPSSLLSQARPLFETPPPAVSPDEATIIARDVYGLEGPVKLLSGERDTNYRIGPAHSHAPSGDSVVLKFINDAEPDSEAEMQALALEHLAAADCAVTLPRARSTRRNERMFRATTASGLAVRGRCYGYLAGEPALLHNVDDVMRRSVGQTAARIGKALKDFDHAAAKRLNLWDLRQIVHLDELMVCQDSPQVREMLSAFLGHFKDQVHPRIPHLRHQAIHNDLSRSNMVVDPARPGVISGVLDFGDMIVAPLLSELAVAASYQICDDDPMRDLKIVVAGFNDVTPLAPLEYALLLDFLLARLTGRILISQWRARQFPGNSDYILRSNREAQTLLAQLFPIWRNTRNMDWPAFFNSPETLAK